MSVLFPTTAQYSMSSLRSGWKAHLKPGGSESVMRGLFLMDRMLGQTQTTTPLRGLVGTVSRGKDSHV